MTTVPLVTSGRVLRVLIVLNWLAGALILALLIGSLVAESFVMGALGFRPTPGNEARIAGGRLIMVVGIISVPFTHIVLSRLRAMVATVGMGDPFVPDNAARLRLIAWSVLALELLHLVVGAVAAIASSASAPLDINWSFSLTRWLAVLLLFVLAQVFEHGARLREDLEGTV